MLDMMNFDILEHAPLNEAEWLEYVTHRRKILMEREKEDVGSRDRLSLDWVERKYQPRVCNSENNFAKRDAFSVASEISQRIGVDGETAFQIILCANDIALHWFSSNTDNRFRILDLAFEASRLLGVGFDTVYNVLLEENDLD